MENRGTIEGTLANYLSAYCAGELHAAVDYYDLPYTLVEPERSTVFSTKSALLERFEQMRQATSASGHKSGEWSELRTQDLGPSLASVTTRLVWRDGQRDPKANVDLVYLMRRKAGEWKIVAVVPYGSAQLA